MKNIIVHGINETVTNMTELETICMEFLSNIMGVEIKISEIDRVVKLGKRREIKQDLFW